MAKNNPGTEEIAAAIRLLKNVSVGWPEGYANPLLKEIFQQTELDLKEQLFQAEVNRKEKKRKAHKKAESLEE